MARSLTCMFSLTLALTACGGGGGGDDAGSSSDPDTGGVPVDTGVVAEDSPSTGDPDTGPIVATEISADVDGTPTTFTLSYVSIPLGGTVASFVAMGAGAPGVAPSLSAQFPARTGTHMDQMTYRADSVNYIQRMATITVTEYGPPGGVIRGAFEATFTEVGGSRTITMTNGRFVVPHPPGMGGGM